MTQDTTEIIATYPIYKPLRKLNFYFKKDLRKRLNVMQPNILTRYLPPTTGKLFGRKFDPVVEELNQFVFLSMETSKSTYDSISRREILEESLNKRYKKLAENTLDEIQKQIEEDPEFTASMKAIKAVEKHTEVLLDTELILLNNLSQSVRDQIGTIFDDSQMILWDLPGDQVDRIILGNEVIAVKEDVDFDIGNVADELALASLAKNHIPLIENQVNIIYKSIMSLETNLLKFLAGFNDFKSQKEQNLLIEVASIFLGKLLGIREPIALVQKQLNRYLRLQDDINEEVEEAGSDFIKRLYEDMVKEDQILQSLQKTEEILEILGSNSQRIRDLYNKIEDGEVTGQSSHVMNDFAPFVAKIYHDLEDFRFITDIFQDIPSFTSMGGGVVIDSSDENENMLPEHEGIIYGENIFKTFPLATTTVYALRGIDLQVQKGEFLAIMGPSGSGKTTLLNILSGIEEADRGHVQVAGFDLMRASDKELVKFRKETISFIYQAYNLLPNLKNRENVQLPADLGIQKDLGNKEQRAISLLEDVGLEDYPDGYPLRLSGGQQQRVAIARSLMNEPDIIFADEPTGDLDTGTGEQVLDILNQFHDRGVTIVVVTHDQNVAARADRVIYMTDGKMVSKEEARL